MNSRRAFLKGAAAAAVATLVPAAAQAARPRTALDDLRAMHVDRLDDQTVKDLLRGPPNPFVIQTDFGPNTTFHLADEKLSGLCVQGVTAFALAADEYHVTLDLVSRQRLLKTGQQIPKSSSLSYNFHFSFSPNSRDIFDRVQTTENDNFPVAAHMIVDPVVGQPVVLANGLRPPLRVIGIAEDTWGVCRVQVAGVATVKFNVNIEDAYWKDLPLGKHEFKSFHLHVTSPGFLHCDCFTMDGKPLGMRSYSLPPESSAVRSLKTQADFHRELHAQEIDDETAAKIRVMFSERRHKSVILPIPLGG